MTLSISIGNAPGSAYPARENLLFGARQGAAFGLSKNGGGQTGFLRGVVYGQRNGIAAVGFPAPESTEKGTEAGKRAYRYAEGPSEKKAFEHGIGRDAYVDWDNAALYHKMSLVSRIFSKDAMSGPEPVEKGLSGPEPVEKGLSGGTRMEQKADQWALRSSAEEVLGQMRKGDFLYNAESRNFYVQGHKDNGEWDIKKYCSLKDLKDAFGYDRQKTMSVKDNQAAFEDNAAYRFTGRDGKEHTVMSAGGLLSEDLLDPEKDSEDKEAADYAGFWNGLANGNEDDLYEKYGREEILDRLEESGVQNGAFTVAVGNREETWYLSKEDEENPLYLMK